MSSSGSSRLSGSQHTLSDGTSVERLPIGNATGTGDTFVRFVFTPAPGRTFRFPEDGTPPWHLIGVDTRNGTADLVGASGGASDRSAEWIMRLRLTAACDLELIYIGDGGTWARELVAVNPTDTDGQHRVELPDGSVVERLPMGRSPGLVWLMFVRTGVPDAEVERYEAYDEAVDAALEAGDDEPDIEEPWPEEPVERFLELRSDGRLLKPDSGGHTEGGRDQRFELAVPADQIASEIEIRYLFDGDVVVSTERVEVGDY